MCVPLPGATNLVQPEPASSNRITGSEAWYTHPFHAAFHRSDSSSLGKITSVPFPILLCSIHGLSWVWTPRAWASLEGPKWASYWRVFCLEQTKSNHRLHRGSTGSQLFQESESYQEASCCSIAHVRSQTGLDSLQDSWGWASV